MWKNAIAIELVTVAARSQPDSHPLIDWGAAIADTLLALAIGFSLLILGIAIGATAMSTWMSASAQAPGWTLAGGLWVISSNLVALTASWAVDAIAGSRLGYAHPDIHGRECLPRPITTADKA